MTRYPLFWRELRAGRRSFLNWSIPVIFLVWLMMVSFPSLAKSATQTIALMKSLPAGLRAAFGLDKLNLGEAIGYFAARVYITMALVGGLYAATYASSLLSKEESERTAEFLLTKPISRSQVVLQKAAVLLFYIVAFGVMSVLLTFACFALYVETPYSETTLLSLLFGISLIIFCFAGIGFGISGFLSKAKSASSLALGFTMMSFVLGTISAASEPMQWMKWLTPFKYADSIEIVFDGLQPAKIAVLVLVGFGGIVLAWWRYQTKDIHA